MHQKPQESDESHWRAVQKKIADTNLTAIYSAKLKEETADSVKHVSDDSFRALE